MSTPNTWTEDRVQNLKTLWSDKGLSATQIAIRMGVSRNAVLGKVHRLGLPGRAAPRIPEPRRAPAARPKASKPQPRQQLNFRRADTARPSKPDVSLRVISRLVVSKDIPEPLRLDLLDLQQDSCRWIYGDPKEPGFHFCGHAKAAGAPYCSFHAARAFRPEPRRGGHFRLQPWAG